MVPYLKSPDNVAVSRLGVVGCQLAAVNGNSGWSASKLELESSLPQLSLNEEHREMWTVSSNDTPWIPL